MASVPMEVLRNVSLLVDGRVCGFGIIEPFVLDNINTLNIEIRLVSLRINPSFINYFDKDLIR